MSVMGVIHVSPMSDMLWSTGGYIRPEDLGKFTYIHAHSGTCSLQAVATPPYLGHTVEDGLRKHMSSEVDFGREDSYKLYMGVCRNAEHLRRG